MTTIWEISWSQDWSQYTSCLQIWTHGKRRSRTDPTFSGIQCKKDPGEQSPEDQESKVTQSGTLVIAWMGGWGKCGPEQGYYFWNPREFSPRGSHKDGAGWWNKLNSILTLNAAMCFTRLFLIKLLNVGWGREVKRQFNKSSYTRDQQH